MVLHRSVELAALFIQVNYFRAGDGGPRYGVAETVQWSQAAMSFSKKRLQGKWQT